MVDDEDICLWYTKSGRRFSLVIFCWGLAVFGIYALCAGAGRKVARRNYEVSYTALKERCGPEDGYDAGMAWNELNKTMTWWDVEEYVEKPKSGDAEEDDDDSGMELFFGPPPPEKDPEPEPEEEAPPPDNPHGIPPLLPSWEDRTDTDWRDLRFYTADSPFRKFVADNEAALTQASAVVSKKWTLTSLNDTPSYMAASGARSVVRVLVARARIAAYDGDEPRFLESFKLALAVADQMHAGAGQINPMVGNACEALMLDVLRVWPGNRPPSVQLVHELQGLIQKRPDYQAGYARIAKDERVWSTYIFDWANAGMQPITYYTRSGVWTVNEHEFHAPDLLAWTCAFFPADRRHFEEIWNRAEKLMGEGLSYDRAMHKPWDLATQLVLPMSCRGGWIIPISGQRVLNRIGPYRKLMLVPLTVFSYYHKNRAMPAKLEDFGTGEEFVDDDSPDKKKYGFHLGKETLFIWSVGRNNYLGNHRKYLQSYVLRVPRFDRASEKGEAK